MQTGQQMRITPAMAQAWLDKLPQEQISRMSKRATDNYTDVLADQMRRGLWSEHSKPFVLGANGLLCEGKHRCIAIVKAGVAITGFVMRDPGLNDVFDYRGDEGIVRSQHYILQQPRKLVGIARLAVTMLYRTSLQKGQGGEDVARIASCFRMTFDDLGSAALYNRAGSKVSNLLAAILRVQCATSEVEWVKHVLGKLNINDAKGLPPLVYSYWRQNIQHPEVNQVAALCRAYRAFDQTCAETATLQIKNYDLVREEIRRDITTLTGLE